jgi:cholesterol 25-hydroxylase
MSRSTSTSTSSDLFYPRLMLWTFLTTTVLIPQIYQPALTALWNYLCTLPFYNLSTFETIVTIVSYGILEPWYTYQFARHPELRIDVQGHHHSKPPVVFDKNNGNDNVNPFEKQGSSKGRTGPRLPKMKRPSKRLWELVIYATPLLAMDLVMIKKFADVPLNDIRVSGGYSPLPTFNTIQSFSLTDHVNTTLPQATVRGSIHATFLLPTLHNITHSPFQTIRALPPIAPTTQRLTLELALSLLIYDILFFLLHLSLHLIPTLQKLHLPHHTHAEIHPQITNTLSIPERLSLVLLANFSLNIIGSHVMTRTIFIPVFVNLLIQVHCGMDCRWGYEKLLPRRWGLGAREHARHHRTGGGCFAPFFGTGDWVLARVRRCRMTGMGEKEV